MSAAASFTARVGLFFLVFFLLVLRPPVSALFPYTTLFRSGSPSPLRATIRSGSPGTAAAQAKTPSSGKAPRSEEHTSELQSLRHLVCRLLLEKKKWRGVVKAENSRSEGHSLGEMYLDRMSC